MECRGRSNVQDLWDIINMCTTLQSVTLTTLTPQWGAVTPDCQDGSPCATRIIGTVEEPLCDNVILLMYVEM